jgi:ubiquinone/menaquinone biosynthesis C-methylase UbiE
MIGRVIKRIASYPWVYDWIQVLAGARIVYKRLVSQLATFDSATVLDLGGGTGLYRHACPSSCVYICLDIDKEKLNRFRKKYPDCTTLLADATAIPLKDESIDVVICICVSHHLTDVSFAKLISESKRVLKPLGVFVFLDALRMPKRLLSRLLWRYDRGSFPRTKEQIQSFISTQYRIIHSEDFTVFHKYILLRGIKDVGISANAE